MIRAPSHVIGEEHRSLEIEEMLDEPFRKLVDEAATAGWDTPEVLNALEELVRNYRVAYDIDPDPADDPQAESQANADHLVEGFIDGRDIGP